MLLPNSIIRPFDPPPETTPPLIVVIVFKTGSKATVPQPVVFLMQYGISGVRAKPLHG